MNVSYRTTLLFVALVFPLTLHSTDIFVSSQGEVKILASLNPHIIPGNPKLGNTILIVNAPKKQKNIRIITSCEHKESILYKESKEDKKTIYVIQVSFPDSCEIPNIRIGDQENVFTDTLFSLPMEAFGKMENSLVNTNSNELLSIMRKQSIAPSKEVGATLMKKLQSLQTLYKNLDIIMRSDIARDILQNRENIRYFSPVAGYELPSKDKLIP